MKSDFGLINFTSWFREKKTFSPLLFKFIHEKAAQITAAAATVAVAAAAQQQNAYTLWILHTLFDGNSPKTITQKIKSKTGSIRWKEI